MPRVKQTNKSIKIENKNINTAIEKWDKDMNRKIIGKLQMDFSHIEDAQSTHNKISLDQNCTKRYHY